MAQTDLFEPISIPDGPRTGSTQDPFPYWTAPFSGAFALPAGATTIVLPTFGATDLHWRDARFPLRAGMFAVVPDAGLLEGCGGGLMIAMPGYRGLFQIGGPLENIGRLRYIDGCTDTLLVSPPCLGEPCLNHLHIPPGTSQTQHIHPTDRVGVIVRGSGICRTPTGEWKLQPGLGWRIPAGCRHSFFTEAESLDVVAWHPDSDFGPTDEDHPMRNRTIL